ETINALGHSYTENVVDPTYSEQGYTQHTCSVCGDSYKDNYTDKLILSAVSGLKITPASSSLTLSWDKNDNATGYFVQQYKDGEWKHIRQLARNTATTYTATGLSPSATYQYRVRAYVTESSATAYSEYVTIDGITNPTNITGVKAASTANSVTISWDKNDSATGYFVQQYKNGAWTHVRQLA
ncbi:MAG: fibronectin type III domain-containing protein, partial [Ruminiclostridium sp.]